MNDPATVERLVLDNLRLVPWVAGPYLRRSGRRAEIEDDLLQEGRVGLIRAAMSYDPGRGCTFATHAFKWIRAAITLFLANDRLVQVPTKQRRAARDGLATTAWGSPVSVRASERAEPIPRGLAAPCAGQDEVLDRGKLVARALSVLDARRREVVVLRFGLDDHGDGRTLQEVGDRLGYSREMMRLDEMAAMRAMRA